MIWGVFVGNLIVKDNALIEASHKLGEGEQRLILLAILKARSQCNTIEQLQGKELIIHADDYINHFGATKQGAYKALKQAVMGLFEAKWGYKYLTEKGEQRVRYERFTQSADYGKGEGTVSFKFADAIIPMLVELERRFTVYEIEQISKLSSGYAMRLYEFFMQHLDKKTGKGWLDISLDDLRFRFGLLPTEYKAMKDFKLRVLDLSVIQINENTDLSANYTQKKQGRKIVGFKFEFKKKANTKPKKTKENTERDPKTVDMFSGFTDLERQTIQQRIDEHIERLETKGETVGEYWRENITKKAIAERWGLDVLAEQQRKEQEYKTRLAIEQAEMQAKAKAEQEKAERAEQRKNAMITRFESLPQDEQEQILNKIDEILAGGVFDSLFKRAREQGTAHKDVMFMSWFFKILDE